jgi:hypothetical protein
MKKTLIGAVIALAFAGLCANGDYAKRRRRQRQR